MNCTSIPLKFKNTSFSAFYIIINLNDIINNMDQFETCIFVCGRKAKYIHIIERLGECQKNLFRKTVLEIIPF